MSKLLLLTALGLALAALAGCNSLTRDAFDTLKLAYAGPAGITSEQIQAVDGPVLIVGFGEAEAMLVSAGPTAGLVEWYGTTEMLLTQGGRIAQTAGLPADLIAPLQADDPFIQGLTTLSDGDRFTRLVDYPANYLTGLRQHATYRTSGIESIAFMGTRHSLLRIDEQIHMPELNFSATNYYWIEPDSGTVRHSIQHIAPDLPPLRLTLAKPSRARQ